MTQYDVFPAYQKMVDKDTVTSLYADNGVLQVRYADGTMEVCKGEKLIQKRS